MGDVVLQGARGIVERRPVPWQQHLDIGDAPQPVQGAEIVTEVAVAGDNRRAPAEYRVAGEQRAIAGEQQAHRVRGVTGRRDHPQFAAADIDDVALGEALVAEPVRRVGRAHHGAAAELGEPRSAGRVVRVPVGEQDGPDPPVTVHGQDPAQVTFVQGTGSITTTSGEPGSATIHGQPSSVIGEGLGASTHSALVVR